MKLYIVALLKAKSLQNNHLKAFYDEKFPAARDYVILPIEPENAFQISN